MVDKVPYRTESSKLNTNETQRNWTEHSPKSKLNQIKSRLNSSKSSEAKKLMDLINKREYRDFQKRIWLTRAIDLDWKLWPITFETLNNYLKKFEKTQETIHNTNNELNQLQDYVHRPEYQQLTESARIHKNAREYLSKHESLSEADYNKLFSGKEQLQQWQIWNCYMVSALIELANTDYFDTLMRTSITRVKFKDDWALWYNIRIPLWEPNGRDILIKDSEINSAKIRWNIGYKLLEIAFVKNKRKNNKEWNKYSPVTEWEYRWIVLWSIESALATFLGKNNIWFSNFGTYSIWEKWKTLAEASQSQKTEIINHLKNFNWRVWNRFTCLATAPSPKWDAESFNVWSKTFWKGHAYALNSVEKDWRWNVNYVNVKNPWNNQNKAWGANLRLSLNEFFYAFSYMGVWTVKTDTFLDNKWGSWWA